MPTNQKEIYICWIFPKHNNEIVSLTVYRWRAWFIRGHLKNINVQTSQALKKKDYFFISCPCFGDDIDTDCWYWSPTLTKASCCSLALSRSMQVPSMEGRD